MEKSAGRVRFRLRAFFEFFAAQRMIDDEEFREFVFDDQNYLSFSNEIGFYSALNRKDVKQLDRILLEFQKLGEEIWPPNGPNGDADLLLQDMKLPEKETSEAELAQLQRAIASPEQIETDRKALLEGSDFANDQDQSLQRARFFSPEERWLGHLILLSGMTKHMELIKDADKRRFVSEALGGWVRFTSNSIAVVPDLAKSKRVVFHGVTYRSALSDDLAVGEVARRLSMYMPIAVARMAVLFLGTEKLRRQIEEGIGSGSEPLAKQFFRLAMLSDLGVSGVADLASKAHEKIKSSSFLEHVLVRKLFEMAIRFRLGKDDLNSIKSLIGDIVVDKHESDGKKNNVKTQIIAGISQQRVRFDFEHGRSRDNEVRSAGSGKGVDL